MDDADMAPYYELVTSASPPALPLGTGLLGEMEMENGVELKRLDDGLEEAKKTEGETEICDAIRAQASYLTRKGRTIEPQTLALKKTPGLGSRIDTVLIIVHIGFFFGDNELLTTHLAKAES